MQIYTTILQLYNILFYLLFNLNYRIKIVKLFTFNILSLETELAALIANDIGVNVEVYN